MERRLAAGPKAAPGLPPCPKHLRDRARSAWNFWVAELAAMKLDKRPDAPMLEGACRAYERAVKADLIIDAKGLIVQDKSMSVTKDGKKQIKTVTVRTRKHPAVEISNRSWLIVKAFCSEFGLSPVSRTRLSVEQAPDDADEFIKMLAAPRTPAATETIQ